MGYAAKQMINKWLKNLPSESWYLLIIINYFLYLQFIKMLCTETKKLKKALDGIDMI